MASRGRGGRFFGRGGRMGGRSGASNVPVAKDEEGNIVSLSSQGPRPSFPENELPEPLSLTHMDRLLVAKRHQLDSSYKSSPLYLEMPKDGAKADREVERYSDRYHKKPVPGAKVPLSSILTLVPEYFPEELYAVQVIQ